MKKTVVALLTTVALSVMSIVPVFATETAIEAEKALVTNHVAGVSNAISTLVTYDNNCGEAAKVSMNALVDGFNGDIQYSVTQEEDNYIKYLKACVGNAIENERVKKQNIGAISDLVKVNATFQPQLDAAIAEYNQAVVDRMAAEVAVENAKAQFEALNLAVIVGNNAKYAGDSDAR